MKIIKHYNDQEWLGSRKGKITGSSLKDLISVKGTRKEMFWTLLADKLMTSTTGIIDPMKRGHELEKEAIIKYSQKVGIDFITDLDLWLREDYEDIALSPDGYTEDLKQAIEVKCLNGAKHLKAKIENKIPKIYQEQIIQYFVVNDKLEKLHFVMYNPDFEENLQFNIFIIRRKDKIEEIENAKQIEIQTLEELNNIINKLTF